MTVYIFYSFCLFLALVFYLPVYFFKVKFLKGDRLYLRERLGFGLPKKTDGKPSLWIHAVSVGEVLSLQNLIKEIKKRHPLWEINFSSLTNTGLRVAREKLKDADRVFFVPLDFPWVVRKFFASFKPCLLVLAESEFWPNLLREARRKTNGVVLINGRISWRAFERYRRVKFLAKRILKNVNLFLVQTEEDKEKLERIGVSPSQVEVAGNLKSEVTLPLIPEKKILELKESLGIPLERKVIVAGSTRKGEEELLLEAFQEAKNRRGDLLLILAPRHPERASEVENICQNFHFTSQRRTLARPEQRWDVLILDTMGELACFYALCDLAFVGGSLVPWGGQNLLEPAFYKKPIFFGPHMDNFRSLAQEFIRSQAARITYKKEDLVQMFILKEEKLLQEMGNRAKELLNSLQGATEKTLKAIEALMGEEKPSSMNV